MPVICALGGELGGAHERHLGAHQRAIGGVERDQRIRARMAPGGSIRLHQVCGEPLASSDLAPLLDVSEQLVQVAVEPALGR